MTNNVLQHELHRLLTLQWDQNADHRGSPTALMREYFRRMAVWTQALSLSDTSPFFDVVEAAMPHVQVPDAMVDQLMHQLVGLPLGVRQTCYWHLHWAAAQAAPESAQSSLPAPYEPLIRMYERGVQYFKREHGWVDVGYAGALLERDWPAYASHRPLALDDATLDALDAQTAQRRALSHPISG